jgi:photosystem II biogenesis protein Psp29
VAKTVADTKQQFFTLFTRPLNSIYRRVLDEILVEAHLLTVHHKFRYDPFFALGLCTAYDRFLDGYYPVEDKAPIFDALCQALGFTTETIRQDAQAILKLEGQALVAALSEGQGIDALPESLRLFFRERNVPKYSRLFALGLSAALEDYLKSLPEASRFEALSAICGRLGLTPDRVKKDLDFYTQALEQLRRSKESLDELAESQRKKRLQTSS